MQALKMSKFCVVRKENGKFLLVPSTILWDKVKHEEVFGIEVPDEKLALLVKKLSRQMRVSEPLMAINLAVNNNITCDIYWTLPENVIELPEDIAETIGVLV